MAKRGILNKTEKYYISSNRNLSVEELATTLNRSVKSVTQYISELDNGVVESQPEPPPPQNKESKMFNLMGRKKRGEEHVATVMTPAASELADATRPQRTRNEKLQSAIHKPKG